MATPTINRSINIAPNDFGVEEYHHALQLRNTLDFLAYKTGFDDKPASNFSSLDSGPGIAPGDEEPMLRTLEVIRETSSTHGADESTFPHVDPGLSTPLLSETRLERHLRYLVARHVVFLTAEEGGVWDARKKDDGNYKSGIGNTLERAGTRIYDKLPRVVSQTSRNDIPGYRALFTELDTIRSSGDPVVEVYLGRDGLWAYLARLGQLAGRKDNEPHMGRYAVDRNKLRAPVVKYLVFPSYMRHEPSSPERRDARRQYVHQQIDPSDGQVHYYDTGYVGSVPTAVDKVLGGSKLTRDQRIHLLETRETQQSRQIAGVPKSVHVGTVEGYDLPEAQASDDYPVDDRTGLIGYRADRSRADTQLSYLLRRHVLYNHFYNDEYERFRKGVEKLSFDGTRDQAFFVDKLVV